MDLAWGSVPVTLYDRERERINSVMQHVPCMPATLGLICGILALKMILVSRCGYDF